MNLKDSQDFQRVHFVYCGQQLFRSFHIFGLEALEATLGDGDIGDEGVQLVHLEEQRKSKLHNIELGSCRCKDV